MVDTQKIERAAQAFLYGYPLIYSLKEIAVFVAGTSIRIPSWPRP